MTEPQPKAADAPGARQGATFVGVLALAFFTLFAYGLARSPIESMFLDRHGAEGLPYAWVAVAIATIACVSIYDRFAIRVPLLSLHRAVALLAAGSLAVLALLAGLEVPGSAMALYVWKDVHVVLLLEIVWTIANAVFQVRTARWAYSMFCVAGSLGGLLGNLTSGETGARVGTVLVLALPFTVLVGLAPLARRVSRTMGDGAPSPRARLGGGSAFSVLARSRYLLALLVLVLLVQVAVTTIDYVYNHAIEVAFPEDAARTRAIGLVNAAIDGGSLLLQLATGPILRFAGVPAALAAVPAIVGATFVASLVAPRFALTAAAKVASKALDYSVFRAAKEILYIPLDYDEKTHGKALVDMVTYRVAKVVASILLVGAFAAGDDGSVAWLLLAVLGAWLGATAVVVRGYRARVSRAAERG